MSSDPQLMDTLQIANRLDDVRGGFLRLSQGASETLSSSRSALEELQAQVGVIDFSEALRRLALMTEVWECLGVDATGCDSSVRTFFDESLGRLAEELRSGNVGESASWILSESSRRWGEYLRLVDPSWTENQTGIPDDFGLGDAALEENEPAIDTSELIRMLTGSSPVSKPKAPAGRPRVEPGAVPSVEPDPAPGPEFEHVDEEGPVACEPAISTSTASSQSRPSESSIESAVLAIDPELREVFLADAADLFERIEELVLNLREGNQADRLNELGRCYHTLKGAAGSVGLVGLATAIHALENDLERASGQVSQALVLRLESSLKQIEDVLAALRGEPASRSSSPAVQGDATTRAQPSQVGSDAPMATSGEGGKSRASTATETEPEELVRVPAGRIDELMDLVSELISRRRFWIDQAERMKQCAASARTCSHRLKQTIEPIVENGIGLLTNSQSAVSLAEESLIGLARRLMEQSDDLSVLAETARAASIPMTDEGEALSRLSLQLWETLQSVRVVPVRGLFQRLVRVARDAARVEGRQVEVTLIGEDTGLDRTTQDRAYEPLLHVVRNAVGHGIEPPEVRSQAGKPPVGRVTLEARREGNSVTLTVQDDGKGLDYNAIAAKGRRLGLLAPGEEPSVERLNALIFQPGFSTRQEANAISGRGVGMDVVAQEVTRLRGAIDLSSRPGYGTRLTIRFQARLALAQTMVVRVDGQAFAMPVESIESVQPAEGTDREGSGDLANVILGGKRHPLIDARAVLGFSSFAPAPCPTFLIVRADGELVAVLVDSIDGPSELVIKPLGPLLAGHPAVSGTSLTTTGEVVLVLNPAGLVRLSRGGGVSLVLPTSPSPSPVRPAALVVDDSISVRRVATRQLRSLGFEVDEANDGEQALMRLHSRDYRLVLTDLEMPRMDGFELLAELRRTGTLESIPVIVTSTRIDLATRRRVLQLGAKAFLAKPVVANELAAAVAPIFNAVAPGRIEAVALGRR